jgi:hypothetical protein
MGTDRCQYTTVEEIERREREEALATSNLKPEGKCILLHSTPAQLISAW